MGPARGARLKTTLETAAGKQSPVFIVGHYPLFLKQPDEKEAYANLPPERRKQLLALFEQHGVVAMLTGHTHKVIVNDHHGIQLVTGPPRARPMAALWAFFSGTSREHAPSSTKPLS